MIRRGTQFSVFFLIALAFSGPRRAAAQPISAAVGFSGTTNYKGDSYEEICTVPTSLKLKPGGHCRREYEGMAQKCWWKLGGKSSGAFSSFFKGSYDENTEEAREEVLWDLDGTTYKAVPTNPSRRRFIRSMHCAKDPWLNDKAGCSGSVAINAEQGFPASLDISNPFAKAFFPATGLAAYRSSLREAANSALTYKILSPGKQVKTTSPFHVVLFLDGPVCSERALGEALTAKLTFVSKGTGWGPGSSKSIDHWLPFKASSWQTDGTFKLDPGEWTLLTNVADRAGMQSFSVQGGAGPASWPGHGGGKAGSAGEKAAAVPGLGRSLPLRLRSAEARGAGVLALVIGNPSGGRDHENDAVELRFGGKAVGRARLARLAAGRAQRLVLRYTLPVRVRGPIDLEIFVGGLKIGTARVTPLARARA